MTKCICCEQELEEKDCYWLGSNDALCEHCHGVCDEFIDYRTQNFIHKLLDKNDPIGREFLIKFLNSLGCLTPAQREERGFCVNPWR